FDWHIRVPFGWALADHEGPLDPIAFRYAQVKLLPHARGNRVHFSSPLQGLEEAPLTLTVQLRRELPQALLNLLEIILFLAPSGLLLLAIRRRWSLLFATFVLTGLTLFYLGRERPLEPSIDAGLRLLLVVAGVCALLWVIKRLKARKDRAA
ncbi:MAG: hypothetical protein VYD19_11460, partial [Myxococcota bacterium]|nr:hypothetical protein [Myxococcota bacterium]